MLVCCCPSAGEGHNPAQTGRSASLGLSISAYDPAGLENTSACLLSLWAFQLALAGLASGPTTWLTRLVKGWRESSAPRRTVRKRHPVVHLAAKPPQKPKCIRLEKFALTTDRTVKMSPAIKQRLLPALLHLLLKKWPQSAKNPHFLSFISPELMNISWTPGRRYPANIKTQLTLKDDFERDEGWSKHTLKQSLMAFHSVLCRSNRSGLR